MSFLLLIKQLSRCPDFYVPYFHGKSRRLGWGLRFSRFFWPRLGDRHDILMTLCFFPNMKAYQINKIAPWSFLQRCYFWAYGWYSSTDRTLNFALNPSPYPVVIPYFCGHRSAWVWGDFSAYIGGRCSLQPRYWCCTFILRQIPAAFMF